MPSEYISDPFNTESLHFYLNVYTHNPHSNSYCAEVTTKNTDSVRYSSSGGLISNVSTDTKKIDPMLNDDPMQDYEEVAVEDEVNPLPIPPKPKAKTTPKKSAITATANPKKYTSSGYSQPVPAKKPLPYTQFQAQIQQPVEQPIYESPD